MTMGYVGEVIESALGAAWSNSGRLTVKFTNVLWPGERITVRAVQSASPAERPASAGVFAWIQKDDGTIVLVAEGDFEP
jgi:acyl dehydratase